MRESVNSKMIVLAREARGLNQAELAERIRMSATNLSKIERGDIGISEELLDSIAETTGFPSHFFLQDGEIIPEHLGYRRRQHVAQRLMGPINAKANIARRHVQFLTRSLNISPPALPRLEVRDGQSPEQLAIKLRKLWNIPPGPIENLVKLMEEKGLVTIQYDFGTDRVDSRSIFTEDQYPVICLNHRLGGDRQRFTLAYELGGLVLHSFFSVAPDRDIVHEANAFAAAFLLPAKEMKEEFKNGITIPLLAALKKKWKVSMIALLYRADDLGFLTANQKRYLLQQFNALKIRRREPVELDIQAEEPKLFKRWLATYRSRTKLGVQEMAALLCLHVDEFMELYS